jgi:Na+/H+-dicarboxylate symporter
VNRSHQKPAWRPPLSAQVLIALVLGILFGVMGGSNRYWLGHGNEDLGHIGMLVIRLLKALAIPLILFSILDTFAKTHISARSGFRLVLICLVNVSVAFAIGLSLMNGLKPGLSLQGTFKALLAQTDPSAGPTAQRPAQASLDLLANLGGYVPQSLLEPLLNNNVISVVLMAILFGAAIKALEQPGAATDQQAMASLCALISGINDLLIKVLGWIVKLVPLAVFGLVAHAVGKAGIGIFSDLAAFVGIITLGLCVHGLIYYPLMAWIVTGRSPAIYLGRGADAVLTGLSTNSSLATVPVTLKCLSQMQVSQTSARLAACAGTNLNNDGVTLYEVMAALFLAQTLGFNLDVSQQITIGLASLMAGIGIAGIPEAGLIVLPLVLGAAGLPEAVIAAAIPLIASVDWFLARIRSGVNVLSDMLVALLLDTWEKSRPADSA